jgi:FKBP-type peptidyl-prolyl cis-trans isomerase SlyD
MDTATVTHGKVVGFSYTLTDQHGAELDAASAESPLHYLHGASNIVPGLEEALEGKAVGDRVQVVVAPEDGYGERHESGVHQVPRDRFPEDAPIMVGMQFGVSGPDGMPMPVWVVAEDAEFVTIDFNHPLAGQSLHFDVTLQSIRDASPEELMHGHAHGPDGHHHH